MRAFFHYFFFADRRWKDVVLSYRGSAYSGVRPQKELSVEEEVPPPIRGRIDFNGHDVI